MTLLALGFLAGPMIWLGYCHYHDHYRYGETSFTLWQLVLLSGWLIYLFMTLILGAEAVKIMMVGHGSRKWVTAFVLTGIGFALAVFPPSSSVAMTRGGGSVAFDGKTVGRLLGYFFLSMFLIGVLANH